MARRFPASKLTAVLFSALLALSACGGGSDGPSRGASAPAADPELRSVASVMQKTILEGAVAGAAFGGAVTLGKDGESRSRGVQIGGILGATAGSYVALIQKKYLLRGRRLNAIRDDLQENSQEVAATVSVMRRVLAQQQSELAGLRAEAATGAVPDTDVEAQIGEARANLSEMERAVAGATKRQEEFAEARTLVTTRGGGSDIDPELAALSNQIAEMRAIAGDLAGSL